MRILRDFYTNPYQGLVVGLVLMVLVFLIDTWSGWLAVAIVLLVLPFVLVLSGEIGRARAHRYKTRRRY